jgi:hypothetical protein
VRSFRLTSGLMIVLNAGLALLVVATWSRGQMRVTEPERLVVLPSTLPDLAPLNSTPMRSVEVETIRDQALFYTSRSFYQPPPRPVELPPPNYEFAGTLRLANGKRLAFLRSRADQTGHTVHVGDDLDGWKVQTVEPDKIVLRRDEQTLDLLGSKQVRSSGLVHGPTAAKTAQTGIRVLGSGAGGGVSAHTSGMSTQPRPFQPPPSAAR